MHIAAAIDDIGRPAWIVLMVLAFIFFWPLGLVMLAFLLWSGRMGCRHYGVGAGRGPGRWWHDAEDSARRWAGGYGRPSGNWAFDEYRAETLRRLEEEQREFKEFLERLRHAKDKAEFDQFMADRGRRNGGSTGAAGPAGPTGPEVQPQG
jgi:Protein of unknown function (DUF2852)